MGRDVEMEVLGAHSQAGHRGMAAPGVGSQLPPSVSPHLRLCKHSVKSNLTLLVTEQAMELWLLAGQGDPGAGTASTEERGGGIGPRARAVPLLSLLLCPVCSTQACPFPSHSSK